MSRPVRPLRLAAVAAAAALGLVAVAACGSGSKGSSAPGTSGATTSASSSSAAGSGGKRYLALGDSVAFGYREPTTSPAPDYKDAASFVGYPEDAAKALGLDLTNASCPGETTASMMTAGAASNGCENVPGGGTQAYRTSYPLHTSYTGTQLAYAISFLKAHPDTALVTVTIGANDGFLCQETTADKCASEVGATFGAVQQNLTSILGALRTQGGYQGKLVLVDYYSTDYSSPLSNGLSQGLNGVLETAAKTASAQVADGYGALQTAAASAGGKTCDAGLLTKLTTGGCGVHPSASGQQDLAQAVEAVVRG